MPTISIKCPNCGAPLQGKEDSCRYCQAMVLFTPDFQEVRLVGFPCPKCKAPNDKGVRFCSKCGGPLQIKCSSCRHDMPYDAAICPHCRASRVVKSLIAEADERKRQADVEAQAANDAINQQVTGHEHFRKIAQRLQSEATELKSQASKLPAEKSKYSMIAILSFIGAFVGPVVLFVLMTAVAAKTTKIVPFGSMCCFPFVLFLALICVGAFFQVRSSRITKEIGNLQQRASEMESSEGWKKYATPEESTYVQQLFKWRTDQQGTIEQNRLARYQEIEAWLDESTDALT